MKSLIITITLSLISATSWAGNPSYPGTDEGAKKLLKQFVTKNTDLQALTKSLEPSQSDYDQYFVSSISKEAKLVYDQPWEYGLIQIAPAQGETQIIIDKVTGHDVKTWNQKASAALPNTYKSIAKKLKSDITIYKFKFVAPGQTEGTTYDGLAYINGKWVFFPKPWRAVPPDA